MWNCVITVNEAIGLTFSNFLFDTKEMAVTNMYYQEVKNNHFFFCHRYIISFIFFPVKYIKKKVVICSVVRDSLRFYTRVVVVGYHYLRGHFHSAITQPALIYYRPNTQLFVCCTHSYGIITIALYIFHSTTHSCNHFAIVTQKEKNGFRFVLCVAIVSEILF